MFGGGQAWLLLRRAGGSGIDLWRQERTGLMTLRDQWVQFKILDVYHPDPTQVLIELHGNDILVGKVIDLSDSGMQKDAFVVVKVDALADPLIVPVERILGTV